MMNQLLFEDEVTILADEYGLELPPAFVQDLWEMLCRFEEEAAEWGWPEHEMLDKEWEE